MEEFVWAQPADGAAWMAGGSYLIIRRVQILVDVWDTTSLEGQERVIGREKARGAPLGGQDEHDVVDLAAKSKGVPTIPTDAHIRLAHPENNDGQRILRRGYSCSEPPEPGSGQIDAGLFFIASSAIRSASSCHCNGDLQLQTHSIAMSCTRVARFSLALRASGRAGSSAKGYSLEGWVDIGIEAASRQSSDPWARKSPGSVPVILGCAGAAISDQFPA